MWHDAADEAAMTARTSGLMAKFGITSIPALVLLDAGGRVI
jgi:thioredoxin-related protein